MLLCAPALLLVDSPATNAISAHSRRLLGDGPRAFAASIAHATPFGLPLPAFLRDWLTEPIVAAATGADSREPEPPLPTRLERSSAAAHEQCRAGAASSAAATTDAVSVPVHASSPDLASDNHNATAAADPHAEPAAAAVAA